jgi:hypothetical protein
MSDENPSKRGSSASRRSVKAIFLGTDDLHWEVNKYEVYYGGSTQSEPYPAATTLIASVAEGGLSRIELAESQTATINCSDDGDVTFVENG